MSEPNRIATARARSRPPFDREVIVREAGDAYGLWSYYKAVLGLGILLLLLTIPAAQTAQAGGGGSLIGIVSDASEDRLGVEGLTVTLVGADELARHATTDARGRFEFLDLDPGNYTLVTRGDGYQDASDPNVNIRKGRPTTIRMAIAKGSTVRVLGEIEETFARVARPQPLTDRP